MAVTGSETLTELRSELATRIANADEMYQKNLKGELSPDEVAEMKAVGDEIVEYEGAIKAFPAAEGFRERIDGVKSFMRRPATSPPPTGGKQSAGDGNARSGSPGQAGRDYAGFGIHGSAVKSLGDLVVEEFRQHRESGGWQEGRQNQQFGVDFKAMPSLLGAVEVDGFTSEHRPYKSAFTTTGASLVRQTDRPGVVDLPQQRLYVADLIMAGQIDGPTWRYMREDTYSNAATTVTEGSAKPEAAFDTSQVTADVRKIAVYKKFGEELLDDFAGLRSFIDGRMRFFVLEAEEYQLLNGDGTPPNMTGILQTSGIQTESSAGAADNIAAVYRGITKVRAVGHAEPSGLVIHPTDYQNLRLTVDDNGQFYGGGPFTGAYGNGSGAKMLDLWMERTVITTAIGAGTILIGNFMGDAQFLRRSGVMVQMTNSDQDDFVKNLVTIRAEERGVLAVYRPKSFCAVALA